MTEGSNLRPSFHGREFVLSPQDLVTFIESLVATFPNLRIYEHPRGTETVSEKPSPPELRFLVPSAVPDVRGASLEFNPEWTPQWRRIYGDHGFWVQTGVRYPSGELYTSEFVGEPQEGDPPHITRGRIYIRCEPGNKEHAAAARKVMQLLSKVATNKFQCVRYPSLEVIHRLTKGATLWIGHDAVRWAREAPDRMLDYSPGHKIGNRPLD